jgi:hypothetical protein
MPGEEPESTDSSVFSSVPRPLADAADDDQETRWRRHVRTL